MKLFIPELGTNIILTKDWTVTIHPERRNKGFFKFLNKPFDFWPYKGIEKFTYTIPKGSKLSIERIYIRAGAKDFSSVTFRYIPVKGKAGIRFWAKLDEVNQIEFEHVESNNTVRYPNGRFSIEKYYKDRTAYYTLHFSEQSKGNYSTISFDGLYFKPVINSYFSSAHTKHYSSLNTFHIACKKSAIDEQIVASFIQEYEKFITKPEK
jgi:hypothetical protein